MKTTPRVEIPAPPQSDDAQPVVPAPAEQPAQSADPTTLRALVPSLSALALGFLSLDTVGLMAMGGTHIHS